jgi:hypothetical protein
MSENRKPPTNPPASQPGGSFGGLSERDINVREGRRVGMASAPSRGVGEKSQAQSADAVPTAEGPSQEAPTTHVTTTTLETPLQTPLESPVDSSLPSHFDSSAKLIIYSDDDEIIHPVAITLVDLQHEVNQFAKQQQPPLDARINLCVAYTAEALALNPADPKPTPWYFVVTICAKHGAQSLTPDEIRSLVLSHSTFVTMIESMFELSDDFRGLIRYKMSDDVAYANVSTPTTPKTSMPTFQGKQEKPKKVKDSPPVALRHTPEALRAQLEHVFGPGKFNNRYGQKPIDIF